MESFARLNQVERLLKKLPGLDCGSCGAPTCKALAEDIVRGEAVESDCVYFLRDNVHKLSEEVSRLAADIVEGDSESYEKFKVMSKQLGCVQCALELGREVPMGFVPLIIAP